VQHEAVKLNRNETSTVVSTKKSGASGVRNTNWGWARYRTEKQGPPPEKIHLREMKAEGGKSNALNFIAAAGKTWVTKKAKDWICTIGE